jgi:hypothetical protein
MTQQPEPSHQLDISPPVDTIIQRFFWELGRFSSLVEKTSMAISFPALNSMSRQPALLPPQGI